MVATPTNAWGPEYSVGIASVDAQHKGLFDLLYRLECSVSFGQGEAVTDIVIEQLFAYVQVHFAHEEELMAAANYPGLDEHRFEHDQFTTRVLELRAQHDSGDKMIAPRMAAFLKAWYVAHIGETDKQMGAFLAAHGRTGG